MPINAAWHAAHRMPKNPSAEERLRWHVAHAAACACRPMPASLARLAATSPSTRAVPQTKTKTRAKARTTLSRRRSALRRRSR
jgi:hypothetical protein